jgi:hypothetical protein
MTLRISETTEGTSTDVAAGSAAVRLSMTDARLSTTEGIGRVGRLALPPKVGAASDERQLDGKIGTVSTVKVVTMISRVMKENSVAIGHASVVRLAGTVGPRGTVELPVGKGGGVVVAFEEKLDTPVPVDSVTGRE